MTAVTEANDVTGALYGDERLFALFTGQHQNHPSEILGTTIADVDGYMGLAPMADDVTLLVLRFNGPAKL